ncbi:type IV pilus assembly protein PilM [Candidatus Uhrbacteria bacterium]|nr:type IV pilus assembly protein PilM [Candidatus Uhrbacteria bacterium]
MSLFGKTQKSGYLGVDIGASSIKLVELTNEKGRARLMTYGYAELPVSETGGLLFDDTKFAGELLTEVCKKAGCRSTSVMAALPMSNVFSTILSLPLAKDRKQLKPLIDAEIEKLSPLPLSEMITYSTFLDGEVKKSEKSQKPQKAEREEKEVKVLVTGAAKTLVQKYIEIFKVAKLQLQALDTESFALIRSLVGKDKSAIVIIDLGAKRTNITIVERGIPFVTRSVNLGGDSVTSRISASINTDLAQAERMKRDFGELSSSESALPGGLPTLLEPVFQPLVNEIKYALQLYAGMEFTEVKKVEKIILTGGSAHLPRVPEYLSATLNMNVYRGDPWARIVYPQDLSVVLEEIGPRMSIAVGLAMREIE